MAPKETYRIKREEDGTMQCPCCEQPCGLYDDDVIYCASRRGDAWVLKNNRHKFKIIAENKDCFVCEDI